MRKQACPACGHVDVLVELSDHAPTCLCLNCGFSFTGDADTGYTVRVHQQCDGVPTRIRDMATGEERIACLCTEHPCYNVSVSFDTKDKT